MTPKRLKLIMSFVSVLCIAVAIGAASASFFAPLRTPTRDDVAPASVTTMLPSANQTEPLPSLADFQLVWDKTLYYRPPTSLFPDGEQESIAELATITVQLVGTIVEPGHSFVILREGSGDVEILGHGQSIRSLGEGAEVVEITPGRVIVRQDGRLVELALDQGGAFDQGGAHDQGGEI